MYHDAGRHACLWHDSILLGPAQYCSGAKELGIKFPEWQCSLKATPGCMQVSLMCGSADALSKVEEPSRCTYTAQFVTPAACTEAEVAAVQQQLAGVEREILGHDEL